MENVSRAGRDNGGNVRVLKRDSSHAGRMRLNARMLLRGSRGNSTNGPSVAGDRSNEKLPLGPRSRMLLLSGQYSRKVGECRFDR